MTREQQKVLDFHRKFNGPVQDRPSLCTPEVSELRVALIREELKELEDAIADNDLVAVADALGDLKYVVEGAAVSFGIDLEPVFDEIHRSNMTKTAVKNELGKIQKGPDYEPPVLAPFLEQQIRVDIERKVEAIKARVSCNRHIDCGLADVEAAVGGFKAVHCWSEYCEDCYGQ
jgi:predicted HAD superfamily Cof-like phosphohydrolase